MTQKKPLHVAIVSYFSIGAYDTDTVDEDKILSEVLAELGISHEIVIWSDPDVEWEKFTCLLIKSVWDYFDYYPEFLDWIERMKLLKIPVWNDLETIKWNSSKEYLLEIAQKGFPVISGMILEAESKPDLELIREKHFPAIKFYLETQGRSRGYGQPIVEAEHERRAVEIRLDLSGFTQEDLRRIDRAIED